MRTNNIAVVLSLCVVVCLPVNSANGLEAQTYSFSLTVTGKYSYTPGAESKHDMYFVVVPTPAIASQLKTKLTGNFGGAIEVLNGVEVLKQLGYSKDCWEIKGATITIALGGFQHPKPFDRDYDWVSATAVKVHNFSKPDIVHCPGANKPSEPTR